MTELLYLRDAYLREFTATVTEVDGQRVALDRSPRIEAARYALEEADERVSEAWSSVYPRVDFSADYTRNVSPAVNFLPAIIFNPNEAADNRIAKTGITRCIAAILSRRGAGRGRVAPPTPARHQTRT